MHLSKIRVIEKSKSTKFKSAEHKRRDQELKASWDQIRSAHSKNSTGKPRPLKAGSVGTSYSLKPPAGRGSNTRIPSLGDSTGVAVKKDVQQYTGNSMVGIAIMHKSCLQPVFSEDEAKDSAGMRR